MNLNPEEVFLAQGTLRPDLIESASHIASGKAEVIKTHHNDTELIRKLRDEVGTCSHKLLLSPNLDCLVWVLAIYWMQVGFQKVNWKTN